MLTDLFIDFDDTLYDTHGNAVMALHELFDAFHLEQYFDHFDDFSIPYWETNRQVWAKYAKGEMTRDELIVKRFMDPLSLGHHCHPTVDEVLRISDFFLDACSVKSGVVAGAHELLNALSGCCRLHIASNGFHEVQYRKLRSAGVDGYFDKIILSDDAGANKPQRAFFDYALRETATTPDQVIMIGDNMDTDITGARDAGIRQIYFNRTPSVRPAFEPTYEVHDLMQIVPIIQSELNLTT